MTKKVKVTQEVADAIERLRNAEYSDYGIVVHVSSEGPSAINGVPSERRILGNWVYGNDGANADKLLVALTNGYEIEPEIFYSLNEWVIFGGKIYRIYEIPAIAKVNLKNGRGSTITNVPIQDIHHATPEEIKAEKECQLWKSIGREVGEFKDGDIGEHVSGVEHSDSQEYLSDWYKRGRLKGFYPAESFISFEEVEGE